MIIFMGRGKTIRFFRFFPLIPLLIGILFTANPSSSQGIIIDHTCTDVSQIPDAWIEKAKSLIKFHFANTSHGRQLLRGIEKLADKTLPVYDQRLVYTLGYRSLPEESNLCVMNGQLNESYITPDLYWKDGGDKYTKEVLDKFPEINVSMWSWCRQLDHYTEQEVNEYLNKINELEKDYPNVTFVYMTGNAQTRGSSGYNRYLRNEQIRKFCRDNNKVLFDFADLDAWSNGMQSTYTYDGQEIPREHPQYTGDECQHTTAKSCENKGRAFWWLVARLAGWGSGSCDVNGDGAVNKKDLNKKINEMIKDYTDWILNCWMQLDECADENNDGIINKKDLTKKRKILVREMGAWISDCGWVNKNDLSAIIKD